MIDRYLIGLSCVNSLGPATIKELLTVFGEPEKIWRASYFVLTKAGLKPDTAKTIISEKTKIDLPNIFQAMANEGIKAIDINDPCYPKLFKQIPTPPPVIYYRGNPELFNSPLNLAVVGSRKISPYCQNILPKILAGALKQKVNIVSGLAIGVDGLSHALALQAGCPTVGVLASGLEWKNFYPLSNLKLGEKILKQNGLIFSECAPMYKAMLYNFPRRNRLIAALAQAVLIAEAAASSGSLITAEYALDFNRDILALPQNISGLNSAGVNNLIRQGAACLTSGNDLLAALHLPQENVADRNQAKAKLSKDQKIIYNLLTDEPTQIDDITFKAGLEPAHVSGILMQLELKGLVCNSGSQNYVKLS